MKKIMKVLLVITLMLLIDISFNKAYAKECEWYINDSEGSKTLHHIINNVLEKNESEYPIAWTKSGWYIKHAFLSYIENGFVLKNLGKEIKFIFPNINGSCPDTLYFKATSLEPYYEYHFYLPDEIFNLDIGPIEYITTFSKNSGSSGNSGDSGNNVVEEKWCGTWFEYMYTLGTSEKFLIYFWNKNGSIKYALESNRNINDSNYKSYLNFSPSLQWRSIDMDFDYSYKYGGYEKHIVIPANDLKKLYEIKNNGELVCKNKLVQEETDIIDKDNNNDDDNNDDDNNDDDNNDDDYKYTDHSNDVACGDVYNMPKIIPQITSLFFNFVKILTPIILIIKGLIDIFKAVTSAKEDEISKAKGKFFKRLVPAVIVFLVVLLAQVVFGIVGTSKESANISQCLNCFLNGPSNCQLNSTVAPENIPTSDGTINWTKYVNKINNSRTDSSNCGNKCRENSVNGIVKVINGVFYYIGGSTYNGTSSSKGTGQKNLNVTFSNRLNQFFTAADQEGYTIWIKYEGWRSLNQQKYYYCCYTGQYLNSKSDSGNICSGAKKCNNGNKAATPGTSNHGYGLAADLGFCYGRNNKSCENDNPTAIAWAKNNASKYGLKFNVPEEDWHIVPYDMVDVTK